ncbi:MAG TPA: DUF3667 domain-containing protein [Mucilaginibacter sp.]|jgi:hypothetical protein
MKKHYREENDCLNCGTLLEGKYCHNCGQENLQIKESFGHMMNHAISDYFHFDHQFFHTLKPLLFKPGFLTNEYMAGRRAQYLHPVKMYIFISIVFFLLFFRTGHNIVNINDKPADQVRTQKSIDAAQKQIAASPYIPADTKKDLQRDLAKSKANNKEEKINLDTARGPNKWFRPITKDTSFREYVAHQKKLPPNKQDAFLVKIWNHKTFDYRERYGPMARETFTEEIQHNTPKMMFLLLPLFALILRFTFWKSKKFYVEHLIYAFHLHCFLFLFLGIALQFEFLLPSGWSVITSWITALATLYVIWYIYQSLRMVYHRSGFRTVTKMFGMGLMYFTAFSLCLFLLFFVTTII